MKYTPNQDPARHLSSTSVHGFAYAVVASTLAVLGIFAAVLALSYPTATAGVVAIAGTAVITVRTFRRFYRTRKRLRRTREVCVPNSGVCVEV